MVSKCIQVFTFVKINIISDEDSIFIFDSKGEIKVFSNNGKKIWSKKLDIEISSGITLGFKSYC